MIRFTFPSLFLYLLISRFHGSLAQLVVEVFKNSALVGPAAYSQNLSSLSNFSIFNPHRHEEEEEDLLFNFSARLQGTLDLTSVSEPFAINCIFFREEFSAALVWIDDHLVCQKGLYNISDSPNGAVFMMDGTVHTPLSRLRRASLLFRAHLWSSSTKAKGSIQWSLMNSSNKTMTTTTYTDIPKNLLHPSVSEPELKRMDMAETLNQGWGTWIHHSLLDFVLLPEGLRVSLQFCNQTACLDRAIPSQDFVRVTAPIASDFSFLRYHIMLAEQVKVSVTMSGKTLDGQDQLLIMVECATKGNSCEEYTLHFVGSIAYQPVRSGMVQKNGDNDSLRLVATGLRTVDLVLDTQSTRLKPPKSDNTLDRLVVPLPAAGEAVGLSSGDMPMSVSNMRLMLQALEHAERDKHQQAYPNNPFLSEVSMATQAAVMYNWIYTPAELSPLAPVSRGWNFAQTAYSSDFHYVIFNWDNVLASYMLTHSGGATKERAYSNLIQVVRSRTFKGFIPNFAAGGMKSQDRTEPPLGAKVLFEMYGVYRDRWIVELLWDDLADYMDWFFKARLLDGLLVLGSDTVSYEGGHAAHSMQGARFESGLDNSPMYDGFFFDSETNLMQMYDVGMTSLVIQELESLVQLAVILDRPKAEILKLQDRADQLRNNVSEQLWDDAQGCFANRHRNGTFCTRITPTSFYPLLTNTVYGESQVASLLDHWLLNRSRFCIDPNWPQHRAKQNSDDCWWGLPSIAADDPAFPQLGYWRGFVWGPMAQIVYWSLENEQYSCLPSVAKARKSLSRQMAAMFMNMWRKHGNVCENFSPHKEVDNCTGDKFYHWGALGGLIILLEETGQIVHEGRFERGN